MDLFEEPARDVVLCPGAALLGGFARSRARELVAAISDILEVAPMRHMVTPGGQRMSLAMTNCGRFGWVADRTGYRYEPEDPDTGHSWPEMPAAFVALAACAAEKAGYPSFSPDACLINRYVPGTRLTLH